MTDKDIFTTQQEQPEVPVWTLTADQQTALEMLFDFCRKRTPHQRALLEGFAGTGKTFTLNRLVERIRSIDPRIVFGMTAPTHKAVRNLYYHSEMKDQLDFGTIHSFLGLKQTQKPHPTRKGEWVEVFERDKEQQGRPLKIDNVNVLIVDEASMISDELYEHIDEAVRSRRLLVIYTGDGLQIPPVGKKQTTGISDAIPFVPEQQKSRGILVLKLSEIVRQAQDNPIIAYSAAIREQHRNPSIVHELTCAQDAGVQELSRNLEQLRAVFRRYFCTDAFKQNADYVKVIAWRNNTVDYFNREIRLLINNAETLPRIIDGDKLVMDKPYATKKELIPNNEDIEVVGHQVTAMAIKYTIINRNVNAFAGTTGDAATGETVHEESLKIYQVTVKTLEGKLYTLPILHEDSEQRYNEIREHVRSAAKKCEHFDQKQMWKQYFDLEKKFAWTKHNYCLTAHKAQGSTYDYAISMEWDIMENKDIVERNRIRYVAATRARTKLYVMR
jgi:ATP-dependent exoDNAse (exonuclease V) alpha subunit